MSVKGLAERIAHLTPEQRALYERRKKRAFRHKPQRDTIRKREGTGPWPASTDQAALWFYHQLDPDNYGYNIGNGYLVRGPLDIAVFERAVNEMTRRHEILRTVFVEIDGAPYQDIKSELRVEVQVMDMLAIPESERRAAALRALTAWIKKPFDLAKGPMLRMPIAKVDDDGHAISFVLHHAVTDWWSYQIYFTEIFALYRAFALDRPYPLQPLPVQYADYAYWRNKWQQSEDFHRQLDYWLNKLADAPLTLEIPTDLPRPAKQRFDGARCYFEFGEALTAKYKALNRSHSMTSVMTMLAGLFAFIHRYAGIEDMLVGMAATNRDNPQLESMIGYMLNILVLRGDLRDDLSFDALLAQVKGTMLEAFDHKDLPFRYLVEKLNPQRDPSRTPIYQIEFVHVTAEGPSIQEQQHMHSAMDEAGLAIEGYDIDREICANDLQVTFGESERDVMLLIEYNVSLYLRDTIERMGRLLISFMDRLADHPDAPISMLPLIDEAEQAALLGKLNDAAVVDYPHEAPLAALFEARAAAAPDAPALLLDDESWSYGRLNARANRIARWLRERGVGADGRVGLCLRPGFDLAAAALGILKAGAAYVPLDPDYPQDRLGTMLQDASVGAVIVEEATLDALPAYELNFLTALVSEEEAAALDALPADNLDLPGAALAAAYVIYTSGSTGVPKGVAVPQRAVARLVFSQNFLTVTPDDALALASSISFDASTLELWGALLNGARLALLPARSIDRLPQVVERHGVSVLWLTAQLFHAMVDQHLETLGRLRVLLAGGDALSPDHVRRFLEACPGVRLINGYGPTENTTFTCCADLGETGLTPLSAPIGRPIANTSVVIVNRRLIPQPVNVVGELCAGGDGLAFGYLNQPALTAAMFTPNPYPVGARGGERLYRTGDLARLLPNGQIEFRGRRDVQVKIRGFRIEPGEIEAALRKRADVAKALVAARDGDSGKRLVAYVVPAATEPDEAALRAHLRQTLPEYMIPAAFVMLDEIPLKPSGKVDTAALPEPEAGAVKEKAYVAPRTNAEAALAEIWRDALSLPRVGVQDNFFDLGGDSLLAIQILAQAKKKGLSLSLQKLFEAPTVAELCADVDLGEAAGEAEALAPFSLIPPEVRAQLPEDVEDAYPMSRLQLGMLFHGEYEEAASTYHDIINYRVALPFSREAMRRTLDLLAQRHAMLRTSFELNRYGEPLQLVHRRAEIPLEKDASPGMDEGQALADWTEREKRRAFDWRRAPLLRIVVHPAAEDHFRMSLSFHHAILDGWSEAVLTTQLFTTYQALLAGETPDLGPEPPPYRRFIGLERRTLESEASQSYWRETLADCGPTHLPPIDPPDENPAQLDLRYRFQRFDADLLQRLLDLCRQLGAPLKSALLAVHLKAVSLFTGRWDVMSGMTYNGRPEEVGSDRTLGLFLNTLPFRFRLPRTDWAGLIRAALAAETEALPHRLFPLPELLKMIGSARPFDAAFNYTHFHVRENLPTAHERAMIHQISGFAKSSFPLLANFNLDAGDKQLRLQVEFDPERVSERQADRYFHCYCAALEAMARHPGAPHFAKDFLDEADRALYAALNQTEAAFPPQPVHRLFEAKAAAAPDGTALTWSDGALPYGELNARANRLARLLRERGAGPDRLIALCPDGGPDTIVALLAILKSGAAYLPFDPAAPRDRLETGLRDAGAAIVLNRSGWTPLPNPAGAAAIDLGQEAARLDSLSPDNLGMAVDPENLAYAIFTSGSTGAPKAVAVPHRAVVRLLMGADYARFAEDEVFLRAAPIAFDASTFEIWGALLHGARLALAPEGDTAQLAAFIREAGVTTLWLTAQLFNLMVDEHSEAFTAVRRVLAGGEALSAAHARKFLAAFPQARLINGYGPTESTTFACCCDLREQRFVGDSAPIGRPIANTGAFLVDQAMNPVPIGAAGELWLGGDGLARCYLNRPALTADRFRPDPFAKTAGQRLYRTGDLVRGLANGLLDFVGRLDRQVKLRGFRVELGEIEHALRDDHRVKDAVCVVAGSDAGRFVAAYVQPAGPAGEDLDEALRQTLAKRLPEYMIPARFLFLERFPLTPNGKLDRSALPDPGAAPRRREGERRLPQTDTEKALAAIWADLLEAAAFDRRDNFFELGGNSIQATRAVARMREAFGIGVPIRDIFDHPTLADLAECIDVAVWAAKRAQRPRPETRDEDGEEGEI